MSAKGFVSTGSTVTVVFRADTANSGSTALLTGYVPNGSTPPPDTCFDMVVPGGVGTQKTVVGPALALRITVDVPDGGAGQLQVFENGTLKDQGAVGDTVWTYAVI